MGKLAALVSVVLAVCLVACGGESESVEETTPPEVADTAEPSTSTQKTVELVGTEWELVTLNGKALNPSTAITLNFTDEYLGGQMGCNGYGGTPDTGRYHIESDGTFTLVFPIAVTVQLCTEPEGIMEQEAEYITALIEATQFQVVENRLEIKNDAGEITLIYHRK
jgi:heat shock protein HslJ